MSKHLIFFGLLFCIAELSATDFYFGYDGAGNREIRTIDPTKVQLPFVVGVEDTLDNYLDAGENGAACYPNPVTDKLQINFTGSFDNSNTAITVYGLAGDPLHTVNEVFRENEIDFSEFLSGTYIIKVVINKKISIFKIIKE